MGDLLQPMHLLYLLVPLVLLVGIPTGGYFMIRSLIRESKKKG